MENNIAQDAQFAAEYHADVDAGKIAEIYAEAYLNAVKVENSLNETAAIDSAVEEFASFIEVLQKQKNFDAILKSAMISSSEKMALIEKAISKNASKMFMNFLRIVAKRNRLDILAIIFFRTRELLDKQHKRIPVVITTATRIDAELLVTLSDKLRGIVGGEPIIRTVIDQGAIGGLVVRVGDTVYDASLSTQLKNVRKQMIEQSAKEIQNRREKFQDN
ncbi:MAG: ATP synthase F1 subunit delta [Planctomycetaceae bacterium]|jgi:F-type H+-transporting ATPase subunit delta|nr:ATP synthase F1 subunit delta [Planctomycetaceae bacterium]